MCMSAYFSRKKIQQYLYNSHFSTLVHYNNISITFYISLRISSNEDISFVLQLSLGFCSLTNRKLPFPATGCCTPPDVQ